MLFNHRGDSILEWVVLAVLVVIVLGIAAYTLANTSSTRGGDVSNWVANMSATKP